MNAPAPTQQPPQNDIALRENQIKHGLMGVRKQIESLLTDKAKSDRFMAAALVVAMDKTLAGCNVNSIVQALVGVAMSDLNVDKNIGHCYLIKYKDDVQLQIGYKGFIQLLFRAGWLVKAFPVYKCDYFKMSFNGWDNLVEFEPDLDRRDEGDRDWVIDNLRGVFAVAKHSQTGDEYSDFMPKVVIEKLRKNSPNQQVGQYTKPEDKKRLDQGLPIGIWQQWYAEMALAKAIKRLAKKLPIGDARIQTAIAMDDKNEIGKKVDYSKTIETGAIIDIPSAEPSTPKGTDLNEVIAGAGEGKAETNWAQLIEDAQSQQELLDIAKAAPPEFQDAIDLKVDAFRSAS